MSRRPGFVLEVDKSTPPTLFWNGEGFTLETLPEGSRVMYAPEPMKALDDPYGAIRHALLHPVGDRDPLPALLHAGMKLTICFDDISLPLPPMESPDIRQMVIETVLDMAADAGVDDVMLIAALALHRRMTEDELRHALGDRVYDAFAPHGLLTQHDAEDPDNLISSGQTDAGEDIEINKRAATSDLLVYVNINLVAMDGGHKSVATGLASYRSLRHHHNPQTMQHSRSFMDAPASELHSSNWRMGRFIAEAGVKIFQIETTLNTDTFPLVRVPAKTGVGVGRAGPGHLRRHLRSLRATPPRLARQIFHSIESPHAMTSVQAGEVEAVHAITTENVWKQQGVDVVGQTDILTMGLPYICPYNVNSIMNPILVACLGLGYFFNLYRGRPLVRQGGVLILRHPTRPEFHPGHHPSYIDFYEQVLTQTVDPVAIHKQFEESFATDPWYIHLYRTGHAYHGVHPFYMWYWCAHALEHLGRVIIVGGDAKAVRRLGFSPASSLERCAGDRVGRGRALPHPDPSARPADHDGGRPLMAVSVGDRAQGLAARARSIRFPLAAPSWPTSVERPDPERKIGLDYDHEWSRRYPVRLARAMVMDNITRPAARLLAPATVRGLQYLRHIEGPVIFAANHASHIDTPLLLTTLPAEFRHHTVVAAASDYFFDRKWKSILWSFALAAIPIERSRVNRRSADTAAELLADGWNLVIFPEGGRSPDGWTQPFHPASAAYLAHRTGRPVVPVFLHGTRHVLPKTPDDTGVPPGGSGTESRRGGHLHRSPISVLFGAPLTLDEGENTRRFSERVEAAVATLAREVTGDWWQARRAVSAADPVEGAETAHRGPEAPAWRRSWALDRPPATGRGTSWPE